MVLVNGERWAEARAGLKEPDLTYRGGFLYNGYDYTNQAWVQDGRYIRCGHPPNMGCGCYGKLHEGEFNIITEENNGK